MCWLERSNAVEVESNSGLGDELLQFAGLMHLEKDIASADEFSVDVDLRDGRPAREVLDSLANFRVFQDIDVLEFRACRLKDLDGTVGKTALREGLGAFHEEHDAVLIDDFLDFLIDVTHDPPSTPLT